MEYVRLILHYFQFHQYIQMVIKLAERHKEL